MENKQIQWIYVPRHIIFLAIWTINKEKNWSEDYIQTTYLQTMTKKHQ